MAVIPTTTRPMVRNLALTCPVAVLVVVPVVDLVIAPETAPVIFPVIAPAARSQAPAPNANSRMARTHGAVSRVLESARDVHHGHKTKHRDAEQQAGPAHQNFRGNAQRRGQQRKAEEIGPKQRPRHVRGHHGHKGFCGCEMQGAEDRQRRGETNCSRLRLCRDRGPAESSLAAHSATKKIRMPAPHIESTVREISKNAARMVSWMWTASIPLACSCDTFPGSIEHQTIQRRVGEHIFAVSAKDGHPANSGYSSF